MCRHIYDWNIVNCDVKQPIYLTYLILVKIPEVMEPGVKKESASPVSVLHIVLF